MSLNIAQCFVGLRLDQINAIDSIAKAKRISRSELIREAVDEWLINHSERRGTNDSGKD